jgi:hypothetical protein
MEKTLKQKIETILNYIGWEKKKVHTFEYDHRCGTERDYIQDVWINKDSKLYYRKDDPIPFAYTYDDWEELEEPEFFSDVTQINYFNDHTIIVKMKDIVIFWALNKLIKENNSITISKNLMSINKFNLLINKTEPNVQDYLIDLIYLYITKK